MPKFQVELKFFPGEEVCFVAAVDGKDDKEFLLPFCGEVLAVFPCCRKDKEDSLSSWENQYKIRVGSMTFEVRESKISSVAKQVIAMCQDANMNDWR